MRLEFEASAEDIKVFLDEAEEQLQIMEADILKLEKEPEKSEALQEIFRAAHTLKGSSATLGHRKMAEVTHAMESLLDKLRRGRVRATTKVIDTLFACLDVLKTFKEEIASGDDAGVDIDEVVGRLQIVEVGAATPQETTAAAVMEPAGATAAAGVVFAGVPPLTPEEVDQLTGGVPDGRVPYFLHVNLQPDAPMPAVRLFQVVLSLGDVGEVTRSWPSQDDIEQDRVRDDLKVVFASDRPEEAIRQALQPVPEIRITELRALPLPKVEPASAPAARGTTAEGMAAEEEDRRGDKAGTKPRSARTVRVDVEVLDKLMDLVGELVIDRTRLHQVMSHLEMQRREGDDNVRELQAAAAHIGRVTSELQEEIMRARMLPVDNLFKKFPRMVRDVSLKAGKEINFVIRGEETELDRSVIEEIGDPLMHLLRNSVDHGVETPADRVKAGKPASGTVLLEASHQENHIIITVKDDGRGIDPAKIRAAAVRKGLISDEAARRLSDDEAVRLIFSPGFSTAETVSDISGRGVGLDVVHKNIERLNGAVEIFSEIGKGTEFRIKLPLTLAIIRALMVEHRETVYCIPLNSVTETIRWPVDQVQTIRGREVVVNRDVVVPLLRFERVFELENLNPPADLEDIFVVIVNLFGRQMGVVVDNLIGEGDVVIKSLGKFIGEVQGVSGATLLGDGNVAIILDVASLMNIAVQQQQRSA